jgi:hypothetical protein
LVAALSQPFAVADDFDWPRAMCAAHVRFANQSGHSVGIIAQQRGAFRLPLQGIIVLSQIRRKTGNTAVAPDLFLCEKSRKKTKYAINCTKIIHSMTKRNN